MTKMVYTDILRLRPPRLRADNDNNDYINQWTPLTTFGISMSHVVSHDKSTSRWTRWNNSILSHFTVFSRT